MDKDYLTGWTTIEQSKKLVEAGLNPDTADMYYSAYITYANGKPIKEKPEYGLQAWPYKNRSSMIVGFTKVDYVPCWTIGKLIDLMPKYLKSGKERFDLVLIPWLNQVQYINLAINSTKERTYMESRMEKTLIDSVISMIERLLACKSTYLVNVKSGLI